VILLVLLFGDESAISSAHSWYSVADSAGHCTDACSTLCALPPGAFTTAETNLTVQEGIPPPNFHAGIRYVHEKPTRVRSHHGDIWFKDPRRSRLYCLWSWSDGRVVAFKEPEIRTQLFWIRQVVYDQWLGGPHTHYYPRMPGVFYGSRADRVQNWLSDAPDSCPRATSFILVVVQVTYPVFYLCLLGLTLMILWHLGALRNERYGEWRARDHATVESGRPRGRGPLAGATWCVRVSRGFQVVTDGSCLCLRARDAALSPQARVPDLERGAEGAQPGLHCALGPHLDLPVL
jgi:hypothetical protein